MEGCEPSTEPLMILFLWIALGAIGTYFVSSAIFNTRRELAWARMALRAM